MKHLPTKHKAPVQPKLSPSLAPVLPKKKEKNQSRYTTRNIIGYSLCLKKIKT
jgi:hypothetical protein